MLFNREVKDMSASELVDELGFVKAAQAPYKEREEAIKERLKTLSRKKSKSFNGDLYRATISFQETETLKKALVLPFLTAAQIKKATEFGEKVVVKCVALTVDQK